MSLEKYQVGWTHDVENEGEKFMCKRLNNKRGKIGILKKFVGVKVYVLGYRVKFPDKQHDKNGWGGSKSPSGLWQVELDQLMPILCISLSFSNSMVDWLINEQKNSTSEREKNVNDGLDYSRTREMVGDDPNP